MSTPPSEKISNEFDKTNKELKTVSEVLSAVFFRLFFSIMSYCCINCKSYGKTQQRPNVRQVDHLSTGGLSEEFENEPKYSIVEHVERIDRSECSFLVNPWDKVRKEYNIKDYLNFSGRPAKCRSFADQTAVAAPFNNTIDPCKQQRRNHANCKDIKYIRNRAFEYLCTEIIADRHKKNCTV